MLSKIHCLERKVGDAYEAWSSVGSQPIETDPELNKILGEYPEIAESVRLEPRLKDDWLRSIYETEFEAKRDLYSSASKVDTLDLILAPIETAMQYFGLNKAFAVLKFQELAYKAAFAVKYTIRTKDFESLMIFAANEAFCFFAKYGSVANVYELYKQRVKKHIRHCAAETYVSQVIGKVRFESSR